MIRLASLQLSRAVVPFKITFTPVSLLLNLFALLNFGFYVATNSVTPVWLQKPVAAGGYGFTPFQNALYKCSQWKLPVLCAESDSHLVSQCKTIRIS